MVDMYIGLYRYLYAFFLVCVSILASSPVLAVTPQEQAYGGFAEAVICSHATQLDYCVPMTNPEAAPLACGLWQKNLDQKFSYRFSSAPTASNGVQFCLWTGTNPANNLPAQYTQNLTKKPGLCPALDAPPHLLLFLAVTGAGGHRNYPQSAVTGTVNTRTAKHLILSTTSTPMALLPNLPKRAAMTV